jgi:hypothetical protein
MRGGGRDIRNRQLAAKKINLRKKDEIMFIVEIKSRF